MDELDQKIAELMESKTQGKKRGFLPGRALRACLRRPKRLAVGAAIVIVLFAGSRLLGGGEESGISVSAQPLERGHIEEKISLSGPVEGTDSVDVVSNLHAEILALEVKEGDSVTKGQILARLDPTGPEREAKIARTNYEIAKANLEEKDREAALGYEKAVQDFQKASADHERLLQLVPLGAVSQTELEQSANAVNDAKRQVESYTVKNGRGAADPSYELQVANAAYELEKREEELADTQIESSIDGTVVRVHSRVGQFADTVEDDKPILSIENLGELELKILVSEYAIGKVSVGQEAVISADILNGETVTGEVVSISPTGEEKGNGSTERVIPIKIRIDGANSRLIAGITARAELLVDEADDAWIVPATAIFSEGEETFIAVAENGKIRRVPVTRGVDGDVSVQVIPEEEGALAEGAMVVTNPGAGLDDGVAVTVLEGGVS